MAPDEAMKMLKREGYRVSPTASGNRWNVVKPGSTSAVPYDLASLCRLAVNEAYLARNPIPKVDLETEDYGKEDPKGETRLGRVEGGYIQSPVETTFHERGYTSYGDVGKARR